VLGNSILHGVGASSPSRGCAALAAAAIGGGVVGTDAWVGAAGDLSDQIAGYLVGSAPDLVLVHTATRDAQLVAAGAATIGDAVGATERDVDAIHRAWPTSVVVVMGPWGPYDELEGALSGSTWHGSLYVSIRPTYLMAANRLSDGSHPNDAGHASLAAAIVAAVPQLVPTPTFTPTPTPIPSPTPTMLSLPVPTVPADWQRMRAPMLRQRRPSSG
jgi:hypothetical protein